MRGQKYVVSLTAAACLTLAATGLYADEECTKGYQDPTPEEEAAMQPVLDSALGALPSHVEGWETYTDSGLSIDAQCMDDGLEPWSFSIYREFERVDDLAQREQLLDEAGADYQAALQANQPAMDAIMARIQELAMQAMAAGEAGDYDRVDAINVEIEKASAEYETLVQGGGALAAADAASEEASRDQKIRIEVAVNPGWEMLGYEARTVAPPAGAAHAFRWVDNKWGPSDEAVLILFGSWRADGNSYDQVPRAGVAQTVTQGLSVKVTADASRLDSVLATIDFQALAALVSP